MRVLFINERAGFLGGVEQYVFDAAEGLGARGHQCGLAYGRLGRDSERYLKAFERAELCDELSEGQGAGLGGLLAGFEPDAIFVHKVPRVPEAVFRGANRVVRMVHDHDLCCPRRHKYFAISGKVCDKPAGWRCWLDAAFVERQAGAVTFVNITRRLGEMRRSYGFDELLVGSRFMADELLMNGFEASRVTVMPPVIPLPTGVPAPQPLTPQLAYVGQLIRGKGVDLLIDALALMRRPVPTVIVGEGNARASLQDQVSALGLESWVQFRGWVDHASIGRVYDQASAVVVPSRWPEPFGLIGLESMLRARPVVAYDVGGIRDWLEHEQTGLLVPPQDAGALARALDRVTADRDLARRMGQQGRYVAVTQFSHDAHLDALEASLLGHGPAARKAVR